MRREMLNFLLNELGIDRFETSRRRGFQAVSGGDARLRAPWPAVPALILLDEPFAGIDPMP